MREIRSHDKMVDELAKVTIMERILRDSSCPGHSNRDGETRCGCGQAASQLRAEEMLRGTHQQLSGLFLDTIGVDQPSYRLGHGDLVGVGIGPKHELPPHRNWIAGEWHDDEPFWRCRRKGESRLHRDSAKGVDETKGHGKRLDLAESMRPNTSGLEELVMFETMRGTVARSHVGRVGDVAWCHLAA